MNNNLALFVMALVAGFAVSGGLLWVLTRRRARAEERVLKNYFLMGLSGLMAKIAEADGTVSNDEVQLAMKYFQGMKLSEEEKALCIGNFITSHRQGLGVRDLIRRFLAYGSPAACEFLFYLLWKISAADGVLDPAEDALLKEIATGLGLADGQYQKLKDGSRPSFAVSTLIAAGVPESLAALA